MDSSNVDRSSDSLSTVTSVDCIGLWFHDKIVHVRFRIHCTDLAIPPTVVVGTDTAVNTNEDITTSMLLPHSTTTLVTTTSSLTAVPVPTTTVGTVIIIARSCTMDC